MKFKHIYHEENKRFFEYRWIRKMSSYASRTDIEAILWVEFWLAPLWSNDSSYGHKVRDGITRIRICLPFITSYICAKINNYHSISNIREAIRNSSVNLNNVEIYFVNIWRTVSCESSVKPQNSNIVRRNPFEQWFDVFFLCSLCLIHTDRYNDYCVEAFIALERTLKLYCIHIDYINSEQ